MLAKGHAHRNELRRCVSTVDKRYRDFTVRMGQYRHLLETALGGCSQVELEPYIYLQIFNMCNEKWTFLFLILTAGRQRPGAGTDPQQPLGLRPWGQPVRPQPPGQRREETLSPQKRVSCLKTGRSHDRSPTPLSYPHMTHYPVGSVPQVHHGRTPADGEGLRPRPAGVHRGQFTASECRRILVTGSRRLNSIHCLNGIFFCRRTCGRWPVAPRTSHPASATRTMSSSATSRTSTSSTTGRPNVGMDVLQIFSTVFSF